METNFSSYPRPACYTVYSVVHRAYILHVYSHSAINPVLLLLVPVVWRGSFIHNYTYISNILPDTIQ